MLGVCFQHRQITEEFPGHTAALDSSQCLYHSLHINEDFDSMSGEPALHSGAQNDTNNGVKQG